MRRSPELTMTALLAHNDIIVDCQRKNFGHIILREGGESCENKPIGSWIDLR